MKERMMMPSIKSQTIEVVIPAYNAEKFIYETLYSLALQSRKPDLITVVNDRSTDRTLDVVNSAARDMSDMVRVRIMENAGPRGPSAARNTAIRNSEADIIALMDADDIAEINHHEKLISILDNCDNAVLAFGNSIVFNESGIIVNNMFKKSGIESKNITYHENECATLGEHMLGLIGGFTTSACAFRRKIGVEVGMFDESMMYCEDTDFFMRLLMRGDFYFTHKIITRKRVHGNNLTDPRNHIHFCRAASYSLSRIHDDVSKGNITLTDVQKAALFKLLHSTLFGYLYEASLTGQSAYREAVAVAWRSGFPKLALDPKHLLRLCLRGVLGRK